MTPFPFAAGPTSAASSEPAAVLASDEVQLLTEIGFVAAAAGDLARAERIFGALARLRPGRAFPQVGRAVAHMNAGRASDAVMLLEKTDASDAEERATLDAWRGFALQLAGRATESRRLLTTVAAGNGDAARLARSLLGVEQAPHVE